MAELTEYQRFVKSMFKNNPGITMEEVANRWKGKSAPRRGPGRPRKDSCASTIVPTADGSGVTTRGGGHLRAAVEGHTEVKFDQAALGAIWAGIVEGLRQDNGINLAAMFPELYTEASAAMRRTRQYQDNYAIGFQMAGSLGAVIAAFRITPDEWAGWYAVFASQRFMIPAERGVCVSVTAPMSGGLPSSLPAEAINQAAQFGGVLGAPGGSLLPGGGVGDFGTVRR